VDRQVFDPVLVVIRSVDCLDEMLRSIGIISLGLISPLYQIQQRLVWVGEPATEHLKGQIRANQTELPNAGPIGGRWLSLYFSLLVCKSLTNDSILRIVVMILDHPFHALVFLIVHVVGQLAPPSLVSR